MPAGTQFCFDAYCLDVRNEQLWCGAQPLHLKAKAVHVLRLLIEQAGQLVTKEALFAAVWPEMAVSEGVLTNCIGELRKALGETAQAPRFIATVHRRGYRFLAPVTLVSPAAPAGPPAAGPGPAARPPLLVGREAEVDALHHWLAQVQQGQRQVVFVTGETGIGKTTLVDAWLGTLRAPASLGVAWGQCMAQYGAGEPYLPVLDALGRLCRGPDGARLVALLRQYAPTWVRQMPALLSPAELGAGQHTALGATRERMLRELGEALDVMTAVQPLVLVLEDLHWSDPATVDLLAWLARRREAARLLLLGTYRPVELIVQGHPLHALTQELRRHRQCVELRLEGLSEAAVAAYLTARFPGGPLPAGLSRALHQRTEGQPLFLVEAVDAWVEQGWVTAAAGQWALQVGVETLATGVPESVRQMLLQQFTGCSPAEQAVLEAASVVGGAFTTAAVAAGIACPLEEVEAQCEALVRRGQFMQGEGVEAWPDGTVAGRYAFRHALHQQVVYHQLPVGRWLQLHRRIGARLEAGYQEQASAHAAELALHFERGREQVRAVHYLRQAGENAIRRSAHREAVALLTQGLALLAQLPETLARVQQELDLQLALGSALIPTKGSAAPEVEQTYARARALCEQIGETPQRFPALRGLWGFYFNGGTLLTAQEVGEQLLRLAQRAVASTDRLEAHYALGITLFFLGDYPAAQTHCTQGMAFIDPMAPRAQALHHGTASEVGCRAIAAHTLWCLGYPAQAMQRSQEALAQAQTLAHPYSLAFAQQWATLLHLRRREVPAVQAQADALLALATAQGFPFWVGLSTCWRGWALAMQGQGEAGLAQMHQGLDAVAAMGQELARVHCRMLLAEALGYTGQVEAGLRLLAEGLVEIEASGQGYLLAEAHRLQGVLLLQQGVLETAQAEGCLQQALTIARRQQAKAWELRAAMSLSRLWQQQGKRTEARTLLAPIYGWFTEGFDTADLQEAKTLWEELA